MKPCFLNSPFFAGRDQPFLGLDISHEVVKDLTYLSCCAGSGCRMTNPSTVVRCDVEKRFRRVADIFTAFKTLYQQDLKVTLSREQILFLISWLKDPSLGFAVKQSESTPWIFWEIAAFLTWQSGKCSKVISFQHFKDSDLYLDGVDLDLLFVEGVESLWLPGKALEFSFIIDYAFARNIPLWVSVKNPKKEPISLNQPRLAKSYRKKLDLLKHGRPILEWLDESSLSKLHSQTTGWDSIV